MSPETKSTIVRSNSRARWVLVLVAGFVALGLLLCALCWPTVEPYKVNGIPFRTWVAQHPDFEIKDPLAAIGTNAIAHLTRILREPAESRSTFQVNLWIWKHLPQRLQSRFHRWYPVPRWQLKRTAFMGLRFLGPEAKAALPEVLRIGRAETNAMVRAAALNAALEIAPESPDTFDFWRTDWESTNSFSRHDLAIYLRSARYPILAAAPLLLKEAEQQTEPVVVLEAFEFFGEAARPAVPRMVRMLNSENYRGNMMKLLKRLGPVASEATPNVAAMLNDKNPDSVANALAVLKAIGPDARTAVPAIKPLLTAKDTTVRMLAAATMARIEGNPEFALPVLLDGLEGKLLGSRKSYLSVDIRQDMPGLVTAGPEAAAILLGECGPSAHVALPALERLLQDKNQWVRLATAQAVWRISGDSKKALPVLLEILNSQPQPKQGQSFSSNDYALVRTIEAIEEMGPAAKEAIPALKRVRGFSMVGRHAVNAALARIEATPQLKATN